MMALALLALAFAAFVTFRWLEVLVLSLWSLGARYGYADGHPPASAPWPRGPWDCSSWVMALARLAFPLRWRRDADYSASGLWERVGRPRWGLHIPGSLIFWGYGEASHVGYVILPGFAVSAFGNRADHGRDPDKCVKVHPYGDVGTPVLGTALW
jgi:hypothetical protein